MTEEASFRKATEADLPRILEITAEVVQLLNSEGNFQWNDTYPVEKHFRKDLEEDELWVAYSDDGVYAFMAITTDQTDEYAQAWDITEECTVPHRLAVSPRARNKGTAQKFMQLAEKIAKERGHRYVRVDTNAQNARMNYVFQKLGYTFYGAVSFASKGPEFADLRFTLYQKEV